MTIMPEAARLASPPAGIAPSAIVDFDVYNPPNVAEDYFAAWQALQREDGPEIVWTPHNGGHWIVVRGETMAGIWQDYANFSSRVTMVPREEGEKASMLPTSLDLPAYAPYRSVVMHALSPKRVLHNEPQIRELAIALIDRVRGTGGCEFVKDYAEPLPISIFLAMCDLPLEDAAELKRMADRMLRPGADISRDQVRSFYRGYLLPYIRERRGGEGQDIISVFANAEVNGTALTDDEVVDFSTVILFAGLDTVVNFLSFAMHFLGTHLEHRDALVANPVLIPKAVEELLRRFPIVMHARISTRDQVVAGAPIREGDMVVLPSALHGIDDRANPDPLRVDFNRSKPSHSTFGQGSHRCIGLLLAKTEIRITLEEWLRRIPDVHVASDARPSFSSGMVGVVSDLPLRWAARS